MSLSLQVLLPLSNHNLSILHAVIESIACAVGYQYYKALRQSQGDVITLPSRHWIILAAAIGAVLGSRIPGLLEWHTTLPAGFCATRKTIVGGLIGAWLSVELAKVILKIRTSTGDLFVLPLIIAMIIGRVGCFLAGRVDGTFGVASTLPWSIDFGDGVPRHPTQIYELLFLFCLFALLRKGFWFKLRNGLQFRIFLFSYLMFRLIIDFWKPLLRFHQLSATQWAALLGISLLIFPGVFHHARSRLRFLRYGYKYLFRMSP